MRGHSGKYRSLAAVFIQPEPNCHLSEGGRKGHLNGAEFTREIPEVSRIAVIVTLLLDAASEECQMQVQRNLNGKCGTETPLRRALTYELLKRVGNFPEYQLRTQKGRM